MQQIEKLTEKLSDLNRFEKRIYFISNKRPYAANVDDILWRKVSYFLWNSGPGKL